MSLIARIAARLAGKKRQALPSRPEPVARRVERPSLAEVELDAPTPLPATGWASRCKTQDADSGRECQLLAGHVGAHRSTRGAFWRALEPGQQANRERAVDIYATARRTTQGETT